MSNKEPTEPQVEYPVECCVKVIGINDDGMKERIEKALQAIDVHERVVPGHTSAGGKYITHNIQVTVYDRDQMQRMDSALRDVAGVKFVL